MTVYLIDGYNVLYEFTGHGKPASGKDKGRSFHAADVEDERRRLLDRIASFMGGTSDKAIVVFDARSSALQKVESATRNVEVYFGSFSHSADDIIERETYARSAAESVVVVSSDYGLQKTIFLPNVTRRSARQFVADLNEHTKKVAISQNCITMGHRVEERVDSGTLERLKALRDQLAGGTQGGPPEGGKKRSGS